MAIAVRPETLDEYKRPRTARNSQGAPSAAAGASFTQRNAAFQPAHYPSHCCDPSSATCHFEQVTEMNPTLHQNRAPLRPGVIAAALGVLVTLGLIMSQAPKRASIYVADSPPAQEIGRAH